MTATASSDLHGLFKPTVESLGYELVDVEFIRAGRQPMLRVYIDSPAGITIDDCAMISKQISAVLDVEDIIPGAYRLEVSSPGLDRPLKTLADFERFKGRRVNIRLCLPLNGQRRFIGQLEKVDGADIVLSFDNQVLRLPFADIEKTRLVPEF